MSLNNTCVSQTTSLGASQMLLTQLLSTLVNSYCSLEAHYPEDRSEEVLEQPYDFDFIIVGSGSAGSAIAFRLAEIPYWKILLIEAGTDPPIESDIPNLAGTLQNTKYDWKYLTEPSEAACRSMINRQCAWPRGKVLGGSSSINALLYVRGNPKDYDHWKELGNNDWSYNNVLHYFKKLEHVSTDRLERSVHGYSGKVYVDDFSNSSIYNLRRMHNLIQEAAHELGYPFTEDISANSQPAVTIIPGTLKHGVRWNTAKAYLSGSQKPNLKIMKDTLVTKVLIDQFQTAYGVEIFREGEYRRIFCKREVILSAGSINTPQLLMLSGIGPRDHLEEMGIPVIGDLPVGYNLQDHIYTFSYLIKISSDERLFVPTDSFYDYLTRRTEMDSRLTSTMFFVNSSSEYFSYPDIQFHFLGVPKKSAFFKQFFKNSNLKQKVINQMERENEDSEIIMPLPTLLRPNSRGRVFLTSNNPLDPPKIVSGYLTSVDDHKILMKGLKIVEFLIKTKTFENSQLYVLKAEECQDLDAFGDEYFECLIRNFINTIYHPVGTCKMGPDEDIDAVVNSNLQVRGFRGLRVADASVMPFIISGNTNIPVIMIGEKAADVIKEYWHGG